MPKIKTLSPHVANLIAAGEVVERPASVVKELMENAIDAGASALTVEIQGGGMRLIRVTDNGCGLAPEEAALAFMRHATSKLTSAQDLESISTLGFRGEALAAIASVSRIELLSRETDAPLGLALKLAAGVVLEREEIGCPEGTTILVRDLFFNTPARLKFMKRDAAEGAAVFALVQRVALSHPACSVKFLRDGKQDLLTPGDGKLSSVLYSVFGRDLALGLTEIAAESEGLRIEGFVSLPACCRPTRGFQHFILNGRPIRSPLLMKAVEEAYRNLKMVGKFPACVIALSLRPSSVDVNVHPAKTEVKFLFERQMFDALHYAVLSALQTEHRHPLLDLPPAPLLAKPTESPSAALPLHDVSRPLRPLSAPVPQEALPYNPPVHSASLPKPPPAAPQISPAVSTQVSSKPPAAAAQKPAPLLPFDLFGQIPVSSTAPAVAPAVPPSTPVAAQELPLPIPSASASTDASQAPPPAFRVLGELLQTYILVEQGDALHLIDKHAAHERLHFDRMQREDYSPMAQTLLAPLSLSLPPEESAALLAQASLLADFGFLLEPFGTGALLLREIPSTLDEQTAAETLSALARDLLAGARLSPTALRDELLHSLACKAAIKGGMHSEPEELYPLVEAVMNGLVQYCPHGRPVAITLTRAQLDRRFGRS